MVHNSAKELLELAENIALLGTWQLDLQTNKVVWSDGSFKMCGYQPNEFEITLESGLAIIHPDDRALALEKINNAIENGIPYEIRKRFITKDHSVIHILSKGKLIKDKEGKPIELCGVFQDITSIVNLEEEYKAAINDLKSRNEFIETIVEHLPIGIAVNKISTGEATMLNSSFAKTYGWKDKDLSDIGAFFEKVYPDETYRKEIMARVMADIESGDPARMNWDNIIVTTAKNEKRIINAKNIPVFDQDLMISTVIDITDKVKTAEKYKYLFQNNPAIMMVFDFETLQIVDCNDAALQKYGYSRNEFLSLNIKDLRPQEDVSLLDGIFAANETYFKYIENPIRNHKKNGDIFTIKVSSRLIDYEGRKCSLVQVIDVTEQLLAEEKLKKSEEKYKQLFEDNPGPMIIWDFETKNIVDCNDEAQHQYGYTREEFLKLSILDIRPEEDIQLIKNFTKVEPSYGYNYRNIWLHKKKNGELMYVNVTGHIIDFNTRKASLVMLIDMTKQIEAENLVKESELKYRSFFVNSMDGILLTVTDGRILAANPAACEIFKMTEAEIIEKGRFGLVDLEDPRLYELLERRQTYGSARGEITLIRKDGSKFEGELSSVMFLDAHGRERTSMILRDITQQKKYESEIKEKNQRFEYVTQATSDTIWDCNLSTKSIYWGNGFYQLFGYSQHSGENSLDFWRGNIHPDDIKKVEEGINKIIDGEESKWSDEYRFKKADGSYAYVADQGFVIRDKNEVAIRMVGAISDITQKKLEEERLKLLESVITNTNDSVMITEAEPFDHPGPKIVYVNEAFTKMTGYSSAEVMGKTPRMLQGPLTDQNELKRLSTAIRNWKPCEVTTINYKKNGEPFWANFSISPVADKTGRYTHFIAIERDVTEQKNAEESLKEALSEKNEILESIGDGFFTINYEWTVTYWNKRVEEMLGISKKKIIGNYLWNIFSDRIDTDSYIKYHQAMTEHNLVRFEDYFIRLDKWYEISIYPSNHGLSVYVKDISERVSYTKAIEERNIKLKEIAYTQSHIVRAPLARILGLVNLIDELKASSAEGKELLNFINISAIELDNVIRDIVSKTEDI